MPGVLFAWIGPNKHNTADRSAVADILFRSASSD
jgi:hypothetical protein